MTWIPIVYRDFYDVPRAFIADHNGASFYFDSAFDEDRDEYPDEYRVYRLPARPSETEHSWQGLAASGEFIGQVSVADVRFDETKRESIDDAVFGRLKG